MLIEVITCAPNYDSDSFLACVYTLRSQNIPHKLTHDVKRAMTISQGKLNPNVGFVIVDRDGVMIGRSVIDLARWIDKKGLTLC